MKTEEKQGKVEHGNSHGKLTKRNNLH